MRATTAGGGAEMRDRLKAAAPDLVVLDVMMPGEDGLSLCRYLRDNTDLPVILLTAMAEDTDRIVGLEVGADDYVTKPFNPRALLARINMSGEIYSIVVSHVVLCSPFAMAVIRMRLAQIDPNLESAAWNLGASNWRAMREVIVPFCLPAIASAFCLTAAVSFDEFAVAWFVSGLNKTVPVIILEILQGNTDPQINAIGSIVFITSMTLVVLAQLILMRKTINQTTTGI